MKKINVEIYSDGSCDEFRQGGYGALIKIPKEDGSYKEFEIFGGDVDTTSTQMELIAALKSISYIKETFGGVDYSINLYADYRAIYENMSGGRDVLSDEFTQSKDRGLWKELYNLVQGVDVTFNWVKGHNGNPDNARADKLAKKGRIRHVMSLKSKVFVYYYSTIDRCKDISEKSKDYMLNILFKAEDTKKNQMLYRRDYCPSNRRDKDYIDVFSFKQTLEYAIDHAGNEKKIIVFCDNSSITGTLRLLMKKKHLVENQRYTKLWKEIIQLMEDYDLEVHKSGLSKMEYFDMSLEEHYKNRDNVRILAPVAA